MVLKVNAQDSFELVSLHSASVYHTANSMIYKKKKFIIQCIRTVELKETRRFLLSTILYIYYFF